MKLTLSKINFLNIVFTALLFIISISYWEVYSSYENFNKQVIRMQDRYIESKKELAKEQVIKLTERIQTQINITYDIFEKNLIKDVDNAISLFFEIKKQNNTKNTNEALKIFAERLDKIKVKHSDEYFFIFDLKSNFIYHGNDKNLIGTRLFDIHGGTRALYVLVDQALQKGESSGIYMWKNPITNEVEEKFAYIKRIAHTDAFIAKGFYTKSVENRIQNDIISLIKNLRYGTQNDGYMWIHSLDGTMIVHPIQGFLNGESVYNYKTSEGRYCFQEMNAIAKEKNSGYLEYLWKYPGSAEPEEKKISFVKSVGHWDWVVGSGFYFREQLKLVENEKRELHNQLNDKLSSLFIILIIIFAGSLGIAFYVSKKIKHIEDEKEKHFNMLSQYKFAFDASSIISKTDIFGNITYVNEKFEQVSGYTKEELIGKNHNILRHPTMPREVFREVWNVISAGGIWKGVIKNLKKDKLSSYYVSITIIPIKNEMGKIIEYVAASVDITELIEKNDKLENLILTDSLTGLGSRVKLLNDLQKNEDSILAIIDIIRFTEINDTFGQHVGDKIIKEVANEIFEFTKSTTMLSYRLHADVYAILCKKCNPNDFALKINNFIKYLKSFHFDKDEANVTFDFVAGISHGNYEALACADMALKNAKRNNIPVSIYAKDDSLLKEYQKSATWMKKVALALEENRILVYFQPIYSYESQKVVKFEALLRLEDENGTIVNPGEFLDVIKQTSLYSKVTQTVLRKTIDKFRFLRDFSFSVNLTLEDLLNKETMQYLYSITTAADIFENLVIEIVESQELVDFEHVKETLDEFKQKGTKISIDDFGTGYSNYNYLRKLDADFVKIDGSIIENIDDKKTKELIASIVDFSKKNGMKTIAEFVSSSEIDKAVQELGIDYAQGYYRGRPSPLIEEI